MTERASALAPPAETAPVTIAGRDGAVEWLESLSMVDYDSAVAFMEDRVARIRAGTAAEAIWLLEHPPLYTAGTSADSSELRELGRFPVYATGRGGRYTYHGPGQRVGYVMVDLKRRGGDVRAFVHALESWIIDTLSAFGVAGMRRPGRIGIWVIPDDGPEAKIAAIGVRVRRWVTYHGISINVAPDLTHFDGIVPCGIDGYGVTSLENLNVTAGMDDVNDALRKTFASTVGT